MKTDPLTNLFAEQSAKTLPDIEPKVKQPKVSLTKKLNTASSAEIPLPDLAPELIRGTHHGFQNLVRSKPVAF